MRDLQIEDILSVADNHRKETDHRLLGPETEEVRQMSESLVCNLVIQRI